MSKTFPQLNDTHIRFVAGQPVFFVATAPREGPVNLSPKGMDSLRVAAPDRIVWVNATGSGNETAAHLADDPRMTILWCSFTRRPYILRVYGTARALHRDDPGFADALKAFPDLPAPRQVIEMAVGLVQVSCGYAVPVMDLIEERQTLRHWARDKGEAGIRDYWRLKNRTSLDGRPTGIERNL